jgi:hypothetical protein
MLLPPATITCRNTDVSTCTTLSATSRFKKRKKTRFKTLSATSRRPAACARSYVISTCIYMHHANPRHAAARTQVQMDLGYPVLITSWIGWIWTLIEVNRGLDNGWAT